MTESEATVKLCAELRKCNSLVFPIVGNMMQHQGYPDRYIGHPLWHGFIEFKSLNGRLGMLQKKRIDDLNQRNPGTAYVVRFDCPNSFRCGLIENSDGGEIGVFTSPYKLLVALSKIKNYCDQLASQATQVREER